MYSICEIAGFVKREKEKEALTNEIEIGLLLPCNVIVYETDEGGSVVSAMNAIAAMEFTGNPALKPVAEQVTEKLKRALERLPK
jgi:uncharacterized protein (DUF302 family)